ncbi:MAG: hypothetical protein SGILL_006706 [Bacillariaceae sp.]
MFHGVAKVGSIVSQSTSLKAQLALWETEIKTRQQQFGCDVFDVMNRNRNAGDGTGGEKEPQLVEIFADAATDVHFLITKRVRKKIELGRCTSSTSSTSSKDTATKNRSGLRQNPALQREPLEKDTTETRRTWTSSFTTMLQQATKTKDPREDEAKKIQAEIDALNDVMLSRKQTFGIDVFNAMMILGQDFLPSDPKVAELYEAAKKDIKDPLEKTEDAKRALKKYDNSISHDDLRDFVATHPQIWAMLSVNCQIEEERCKEVAFRVALELASGLSGHDALEAVITKASFRRFQRRYIEDAKGHQELFHRTVFMAFDEDWNGVLDMDETDKFLDTFYIDGSIFQGDKRLPEKEELKTQILEHLDENGDGMFSFDEVRSLISGRGGDRSCTLQEQ